MSAPSLPRRLLRSLRRAADAFPPTARGLVVAGLAGLALRRWGYGGLDLVLFVVGIAGLVLVVLAAIAVAATAIALRRRLRARGDAAAASGVRRLETGSPIATGFSIPAWRWLPMVRPSWRWLDPDGVRCRSREVGRRRAEEAIAERRCEASAIRRRFEVGDVFGLAQVAWEVEDPAALTVLPAVGGLRRMPVVPSFASAEGIPHPSGAPEGDRMEIRRYVPGDSARHILWKAYAKTGQLNVRLPERSVDRAKRTVAYLVAGPDDEAAAAAARVAIETGGLGERWVFGADGTAEPIDRLDDALQAIARSGRFGRNGHAGQAGLGPFLDKVAAEGDAHCVVFAAARPGPWTAPAMAAVRGYRGGVSWVLGLDGVARDDRRPLWRRLLFEPAAAGGIPAGELAELLRRLGGGAVVVDRASGRSWGSGRALEALR